MSKNDKLLIVESPTKAHTIKGLLHNQFNVLSSRGHIKDLPKSKLGVDVNKDFLPSYIKIRGKAKVINELKDAAKKAKEVYIGCDPDREGEAIANHIAEEISNGKKPKRVLFYEITKTGIDKALANPIEIDYDKVNAHIARRVLDRLVGYLVSPILWKTVKSGLSAGRVQTVALRLIVEREREILKFIPEEYWLIKTIFTNKNSDEYPAMLAKIDGKEKEIKSEEETNKILKDLQSGIKYFITKLETKEKHYHPAPPFITATMQQEASQKLGFTAKKTMFIAQQIFEGIKLKDEETGLITYPRTDSFRTAEEFITSTRNYIKTTFGQEYLPQTIRRFKERGLSQGAHESIRPTAIEHMPESIKHYLSADQYKLYNLIYRRFLASQMSDSVYAVTDVETTGKNYMFKSQGVKQMFAGFEKVYSDAVQEKSLPLLKKDEEVLLKSIDPEQHFTQPPARYSEATLIKKLQINGIGRPSTYASIVSTVLERRYVEKKQGRLWATQLGFLVNDILIKGFDNIFEVSFTKKMEEELDSIEAKKETWQNVIKDFYQPFKEDLDKMQEKTPEIKKETTQSQLLDEKCPTCGKQLTTKWGRFGQFIACSGYPECKYIKKDALKEPPQLLETKCPQCGKPLVERASRFGKFIACSGYPECKYIQQNQNAKEPPKLLEEKCPECGKQLVERKGRFGKFIACSGYPECKYRAKVKKTENKEEDK
jgi:DNA topoisomerase-1